jgi:iron(III) transport system substrate-binding protein
MKHKVLNKIIVFILSSSFIFLYSCKGNSSKEVIVYTSVDQVFSEPILKYFEKETGIKVKAVYDTEETKSTGVLNRLIAEKDNPQCDVFWSGDPIRTIVLKNNNITTKYFSPEAKDISPVYKDKDGHWTGFSARARVLLYNKKKLSNKKIPSSVFDLTNKEYKGKATIANPLFGTTTFHIAALFAFLGEKKAKMFMNEIKQNAIAVAGSNGDVKKKVIQGEKWWGITDTDDAFEALKESNDVDYLFPDQSGIGCLIIPNTVCLIKGSPNSKNGKKLIDYLLSKKTEAKLAVSCAQMPLHKGVKTPNDVPSLDKIVPMDVDYNKAAEKLTEIQSYLKSWVKN